MHLCFKKACFLACFFFLSSSYCHAMPEDRKQIAYFSANSVDINQKTHLGEYQGDVQLDQGTTHLRALSATTQMDKNNKLILATALGDATLQAHFWTKTALDKPELHAYANIIRYYPNRHLIELAGDARIVQDENLFTAPKISYDMLNQSITSKAEGKNRITIVLHPEKKS